MNMQTSSSTIKINLPSGILQNAKREADRIGISVQDFIRMLMGSYFASKSSSLLERAKKEISEDKFTIINNNQDLDKFLKNIR